MKALILIKLLTWQQATSSVSKSYHPWKKQQIVFMLIPQKELAKTKTTKKVTSAEVVPITWTMAVAKEAEEEAKHTAKPTLAISHMLIIKDLIGVRVATTYFCPKGINSVRKEICPPLMPILTATISTSTSPRGKCELATECSLMVKVGAILITNKIVVTPPTEETSIEAINSP